LVFGCVAVRSEALLSAKSGTSAEIISWAAIEDRTIRLTSLGAGLLNFGA